jgi:ubiquinone/menaquinone biosynthesis C-methylase UbiE
MSFSTYFSKQARKPSGLFGRIVMPVVFDRGNAFLNGFVNALIAVQPNDRVLEIGCGTGKLINIMAKKIDKGIISGIDFSSTMVTIAKRRNIKNIASGTVSIIQANFDDISYTKGSFSKVCSVNTLYFWKNPENTVKKVFDLLDSGGQFFVAFEDIKQLEKRKLSGDVFQLYTDSDVKSLLTTAGFSNGVFIESRKKGNLLFHCAVATK